MGYRIDNPIFLPMLVWVKSPVQFKGFNSLDYLNYTFHTGLWDDGFICRNVRPTNKSPLPTVSSGIHISQVKCDGWH